MSDIQIGQGGTQAETTSPDVARDICVVIPAFNEALLVGRCIRSVLDAGVPPQHVFVVDDRSTDETAEVVRAFESVNLLMNTTKHGKLGGFRRAITECQLGERFQFVSILDADSHVSAAYFSEVVSTFAADPKTVLVCGAPQSDRHNWLTATRAVEYAISMAAYRPGQAALGVITVAPGCASTYRTSILDKLSWSAGTLVEDMELTVQIHRRQLGRIAFAPRATTYTQDPSTLRDYVGQLTRWYSGTWQVFRLHRIPFGWQRVDAEFALLTLEALFYSVVTLLLPVFAVMNPLRAARWLLLDYAVWAVVSCACAVRLRRPDVLKSLFAFPLMRIIGAVIILRTFWLEGLLKRGRKNWFSTARYQHTAATV
jgi:biofilm PGA synthesis N-glycosyltransferase PgaC